MHLSDLLSEEISDYEGERQRLEVLFSKKIFWISSLISSDVCKAKRVFFTPDIFQVDTIKLSALINAPFSINVFVVK